MKKAMIILAVLAVVFAVDAMAKRYYGVYMYSGRASADTVLTLPVQTDDYYCCCATDTINFQFFDADSNYVTQFTLGPGQCYDSEGDGFRAKYVHINAPDATNTVTFYAIY